MELVDVQVRFDENPVVEIPVEAHGPLGGVVAESGDHAWCNRAGGSGGGIARNAAGSALQPSVASLERPRAPTGAACFSWRIRANHRVLDARDGVLRLLLAGQQVGCRDVSALADYAGKCVESDAAGDKGPDATALLEELSVFSTNTQRSSEEGSETVLSRDSTIDSELRKESIGLVVEDAAEA